MMPTTSFCDRGALTMGSKIGGSAMSALVPAGDFEGHQRGWPAQVPARHDEVDFLELAGGARVRLEVGDRRRREGRAGHLDLSAALFESGHPEIVRDDAREGFHELDLLPRSLGDRFDDVNALAKLVGQVPDLALLTDLRLQLGEVLLRSIDVGGETRLGARQHPPVHADPEHQGQTNDPEQPTQAESPQPDLESLEPGTAPAGARRGEGEPYPWGLAPRRRSARPTATARA